MVLGMFKLEADLDLISLGRAAMDFYPEKFNAPIYESTRFKFSLGGSPGNTAIGAAKLGLRTGFIGRLTDDMLGQYLMRRLEADGINTEGIVIDRSGAQSGLAFVEIRSPSDCGLVMYRENAVDLRLEPADISSDYIRGAKALLVSGTALSRSPSREAALLALEYARNHDVVTIMDIDYRPYSWVSPDETSIYLSLAAAKCNIIIGTREEFDVLDAIRGCSGDDRQVISRWFKEAAQIIIIKFGMNGSTAYLADGSEHTAEVFPVEAKMTNGAGDAYSAGLLYGLIKDLGIARSMEVASASAALNLLGDDCSYAMPTLEQVRQFLAERGRTETLTP